MSIALPSGFGPSAHLKECKNIFSRGSRTYYYSSLFFPLAIRQRVSLLYAFVRLVDDAVDVRPVQEGRYLAIKQLYEAALESETTPISVLEFVTYVERQIVFDFVRLTKTEGFDKAWMEAFFWSMDQDNQGRICRTPEDTQRYVYGSAEIIGLCLSRILDLPESSHQGARALGRFMQHANFIRDIAEDQELKRVYLPSSTFSSLDSREALMHPVEFSLWVREEIVRALSYYDEALPFLFAIPWRLRVPIATASVLYAWVLEKIAIDPFLVFQRKLKPSLIRILWTAFRCAIGLVPRWGFSRYVRLQ